MIWVCFAITGPGQLEVIKVALNSSRGKCETNSSVYQLKLGPHWITEQGNDPKQNSKIYARMAEKEKNEGVATVQSKSTPQPD